MGPGILALVVLMVGLWAQPSAMAGVFGEDGYNLVLAKALAEGGGYHYVHLPGAPPGVNVPFLYPAALSLWWRLWPAFPANVALFQLFDATMLAAAAWIVARHARRLPLPVALSLPVIALGFVAHPMLTLVGARLSGPLFLALAAGAVVIADAETPSVPRAAAAAALAGLAGLTSPFGIPVSTGIVAVLGVRRRWRAALVAAAVAGAIVAPWMCWVAIHAGGGEAGLGPGYATYIGTMLDAARTSGVRVVGPGILRVASAVIVPPLPAILWWPAATLVVCAIGVGGILAWRKAPTLVAVLLICGIMASVSPPTAERDTWILLPWLFALAATAAWWAWSRGRWWRIATVLVMLITALGFGRAEVASLAGRRFAESAEVISGPFPVLTRAIAAETDPSAIVAAENEALVYLYAGRRAVPNHVLALRGRRYQTWPRDSMVALWCGQGVAYVATAGAGSPATPLIAALSGGEEPALRARFQITRGAALYDFRCPR
jgi:hypothetical protein